jgi:hypothetical protein
VGSVEIGNCDIRRRRAGIGYCRNLGNCGRVTLSNGADRGSTKLGATKKSAPARAERAKDLAAKVIDSFSTHTTDVEETASRKRRLLNGPEEFRELRVDRPRAKTK